MYVCIYVSTKLILLVCRRLEKYRTSPERPYPFNDVKVFVVRTLTNPYEDMEISTGLHAAFGCVPLQDLSKQIDFDLKSSRNSSKTNSISNAYVRKALTIEMMLFTVVRTLRSALSEKLSPAPRDVGMVCYDDNAR